MKVITMVLGNSEIRMAASFVFCVSSLAALFFMLLVYFKTKAEEAMSGITSKPVGEMTKSEVNLAVHLEVMGMDGEPADYTGNLDMAVYALATARQGGPFSLIAGKQGGGDHMKGLYRCEICPDAVTYTDQTGSTVSTGNWYDGTGETISEAVARACLATVRRGKISVDSACK